MIKGAIFDVDGVLLDSMGIWDDLGARYLRSLDKIPEEGLNKILFSMSMEQGAEYLNEHYGLNKSVKETVEGIGMMLEDYYFYEVLLKPGAKEVLEFLKSKNIKMAAATSSPRTHIEKALSRNGLLGYIEIIYTTSEVGVSKHSPDIYNLAADFLKTKREETLVFEDSLYALNTAKEAGFVTVGVFDEKGESNQAELENQADLYLKKLDDFIVMSEKILN
ncbi:haloacid dehalogenase superfamily, subfamily IA, variant 3 with third motif having DD or ED [Lachnospiraceae bacterium G41]|nr:haloacid dehalogenase superfamily, subfamily IA, variant 3 with third motif having DD or ED [Lachnospiraceae bacterium G41]